MFSRPKTTTVLLNSSFSPLKVIPTKFNQIFHWSSAHHPYTLTPVANITIVTLTIQYCVRTTTPPRCQYWSQCHWVWRVFLFHTALFRYGWWNLTYVSAAVLTHCWWSDTESVKRSSGFLLGREVLVSYAFQCNKKGSKQYTGLFLFYRFFSNGYKTLNTDSLTIVNSWA